MGRLARAESIFSIAATSAVAREVSLQSVAKARRKTPFSPASCESACDGAKHRSSTPPDIHSYLSASFASIRKARRTAT